MKMQIAFTELSFQRFSGKFVTLVPCPKPMSWNVNVCFCTIWGK